MYIFEPLVFGLLGLIFGSFLNVVILRYNTGRSLQGSSGCMSCGEPLTAVHLIPVLSWVAQRGKCSVCGTRISIQYPLVELGTAILFALVGATQLPLVPKILACAVSALLIAIVVYDIKHTIIPNAWVYGSAILALILHFILMLPASLVDILFILIAGPIVAAPIAALWVITRGRGIGLADVKLALVAGWLLGMGWGIVVVMFSFVIGAAVSLLVLLPYPFYRRMLSRWGILKHTPVKTFTMKSEIPFGPFLVAGILCIWFLQLFGIENHVLTYTVFL